MSRDTVSEVPRALHRTATDVCPIAFMENAAKNLATVPQRLAFYRGAALKCFLTSCSISVVLKTWTKWITSLSRKVEEVVRGR